MTIYDWPKEKFDTMKRYLCASDIHKLKQASSEYDSQHS